MTAGVTFVRTRAPDGGGGEATGNTVCGSRPRNSHLLEALPTLVLPPKLLPLLLRKFVCLLPLLLLLLLLLLL